MTTAAPDLRSVSVQNVATDTARFCFDQPVANFAGNANLFHLVGYNDIFDTTGVNEGPVSGNANCVDVEFTNTGSDISQYTVGVVDAGAVQSASGPNTNVEGAAALTGISLGNGGLTGRTTGPDMTGATVSGTDVLFTHDEKLDPLVCNGTSFVLWQADGTMETGISCTIESGSTARVLFADTTGATKFFEYDGAVQDLGGHSGATPDPNPMGSTTNAITCSPTPANCTADLTGVTRINSTTVDYTFDHGDDTVDPTCDSNDFYVFEEDTTRYQAGGCTVTSSSGTPGGSGTTVVRATFAATANFSNFETPTAAVDIDAIMHANWADSTHGARTLGTSREASGFTDAPDLESAEFQEAFNRIVFDFDENVDPATATDPNDFCVVDNDAGNSATTCATSVDPVPAGGSDKVIANFTSTQINTAVGALVRFDAARDFPANINQHASVGRGPAPNAGSVQLSASSYTVNEGSGSVTITVTRSGGSAGAASVQYSTSPGTATGADFTAVSGTLNWGDGDSSSKAFSVPITDDLLSETTESFSVTLSNATGASMGTPSAASVAIVDNESVGALAFSAASYSVSEATSLATITVNRTGGTTGTVSVNYSTSPGTATPGSDYSAVSGTLTFASGVSSQSFTVPIINDTAIEGNETVNLNLSSPSGGGTLASPSSAVLTIVDDEVANPGSLAFSSATHSVSENAGSQTMTVNRSGGTTGVVSVQYSTSAGSATAGSDYQTVTGTLTFLAGETTKTFSVPILNDSIDESTENFTVTLSNATGGATITNPSSSVVSITDDDASAPGTVTSDVSIRYKARRNTFKGRVFTPTAGTSEMGAVCRDDREVVLRKTNGARKGRSFTGPDGRWKVRNRPNPNGGWYAVVKATGPRTLSDGSQVICTRGQSRVIFP